MFLISDTEILINDETFNQAGLPRSGLSEQILELNKSVNPYELDHAFKESDHPNDHRFTKILLW